jgi:hypothetical protein
VNRANLLFAIFSPIVVAIIVGLLIVAIGEVLLVFRAIGDAWAYAQGNDPHSKEIAKLYPVVVALLVSTVAIIGGGIASSLAPKKADH